jgi:MYXO-CTERM domain-containing protein
MPRALATRTLPFVSVATLLLTSEARAQNTQPDGTIIPCCNGAGEQMYFAMHGDGAINVMDEASTSPETFEPHCHLTFTLVVHDADFDDEFGWYNVVPGGPPLATDLHRMLEGSQPPGSSATIDLSLWTGGQIAFYMRDNTEAHTYYSQRAYNPDTAMSMGYIHMLAWNSHAMPNAFYFGWEDLFGTELNDNDFNDMLVLVQGITCSGGGGGCTVAGAMGVCAQGVQQCRAGVLTCLATTTPSPERCDGADNDCNGSVDDAPNLCPAGQVCDRGTCLPQCVEGGCFENQVCTMRGTCVESACANVACPAGQRCVGGTCVGGCDGVVCPHGQSCRDGVCIDACVGITCGMDDVCVDGACQPSCACRPCNAGSTCAMDGACVDNACATMTCAAGQFCASGTCMDACAGAQCPTAQACVGGACVEVASAGSDGGGIEDSSVPLGDAGSGLHDSGVVGPDAHVVDESADGSFGTCGCGVAPGRGFGGAGLAALAAMIAAHRRRRTNTRARSA